MARSHGGEWLVRIEDLDTPRIVPGAADDILQTLDDFGMHWDGSVIYQSRRHEYYQNAVTQLSDAGLTYPCTCSRREVAQQVANHTTGGFYPGTCRSGTRHSGRPAALRLRTNPQHITFYDSIQGTYTQHLASAVGDFIIRRSDGLFAYQLAVVVDDAAQQITHIVRGSDLLDSTPRQLYLQRLLGLSTPRYSHLPLAVDHRGHKLSKQTRAHPLDRRKPGPAIVAALHFLNQNPPRELAWERLGTIWTWALAHWGPAQVPAAQISTEPALAKAVAIPK
jgi:glutamyl-Q tRNA(Asp) synthetase